MHTHKILLLNLGYGTGLDGSLRNYILKSWRYLHTPRRVLRRVDEAFAGILQREHPDICCLLEMHHDPMLLKSFAAYRCKHVDTKYGIGSFLKRLPIFRDNCNGIFSTERLSCHTRYFQHGVKKLIYEVSIHPDISLFVAHFSLHASIRQQQFQELEKLIAGRKHVIVCGDFNAFHGRRELRHLLQSCDLRIVNPPHEETFPTVHPKKCLDMFLCSESIQHVAAHALKDAKLSDHLPVLLEVTV